MQTASFSSPFIRTRPLPTKEKAKSGSMAGDTASVFATGEGGGEGGKEAGGLLLLVSSETFF